MPWNYPPGQSREHRLVEIIDLTPGTEWSQVEKYFKPYKIELHHFFGSQGLVQFNRAKDALKFVTEKQYYISELRATVTISAIPSIVPPISAKRKMFRSQVLRIQVIRLRCYLGIHDIYEECSRFGIVEKIICFQTNDKSDKSCKFALVQMQNVEQASIALANLNNPNRYAPSFELRVEYSKNTNIVIQFNNSKSFDFTVPGAKDQFEMVKEGLTNEFPFFEPDTTYVPKSFDLVRPIQFDPSYGNALTTIGLQPKPASYARNIFQQYGIVLKVKVVLKQNECWTHVQMRNAFYARLAQTNMNGTTINGKKLNIELSNKPNVHPETNDTRNQIDYQEYDSEQDDPDIQVFAEMWKPSQYISVRPKAVSLKDFANGHGIEYIGEKNMLKFQNIDAATDFIATNSLSTYNGKFITLYYAKPPNVNLIPFQPTVM